MGRPYAVTDYRASRVISHEYDAAVASEGLRSVLAVPIVVHRRVRGVLYGALRQPFQLGDRPLNVALDAARELEQALAVRDEAQRLLSFAQPPTTADPRAWEEVREAHTELRALAARIPDPHLRQELLTACTRLATAGAPAAPARPAAPPHLTPRELDVLCAVASGATNSAAADPAAAAAGDGEELSALGDAQAGRPHPAGGGGGGPPRGPAALSRAPRARPATGGCRSRPRRGLRGTRGLRR